MSIRSFIKQSLLLINIAALSTVAQARDLSKDFDSLGTNQEIVERARKLQHKNRVQIVQRRSVDRFSRLEVSLQGGMVAGGDAYYDSVTQGVAADFHLNPRWSLGARHYEYSSELTTEGQRIYDEASRLAALGLDYFNLPELDHPIRSTFGTVTWYPLYGKINFFDWTTIQFDFYLLAGYGQMVLSTGSTPTYTGGGGFAVWLNNYVSTRAEIRYQGYKDLSDTRQMDTTIGMLSVGVLL